MLYYSPSTAGFYDSTLSAADQIPADAIAITPGLHAQLLAGQSIGKRIVTDPQGKPALADPLPPSPDQLLKALTRAVQDHLDAQAQAAGYDSIYTAVTYADEPAVPKFQSEGQAFRAWRSLVWAAANAAHAEVLAGARPVPTAAVLIAELPTLNLP